MEYIYFDNAATTNPSQSVIKKYNEALELYYNPSANYLPSVEVKKLIDDARLSIVDILRGQGSFVFTSCASEANNQILHSALKRKDKNYIISAGEHSSIYNTAMHMKSLGYDIRVADLKPNGCVDENTLLNLIDENTVGVSLIHLSNETGAINDINELTAMIKNKNKSVMVHFDGVQAVGKIDINLQKSNVDFYTISAHKIYGLRGIAGFFIKKGVKITPLIFGGEQELGLRAGTENVAGILSFKTAIQDVKLSDYTEFKKVLLDNLDCEYLLVSDFNCSSAIISICFKGIRGETLVNMLASRGFIVGTGSACNSKFKGNRTLQSMGILKNFQDGNIRISFGKYNTLDQVKLLALNINNCIKSYLKQSI